MVAGSVCSAHGLLHVSFKLAMLIKRSYIDMHLCLSCIFKWLAHIMYIICMGCLVSDQA